MFKSSLLTEENQVRLRAWPRIESGESSPTLDVDDDPSSGTASDGGAECVDASSGFGVGVEDAEGDESVEIIDAASGRGTEAVVWASS